MRLNFKFFYEIFFLNKGFGYCKIGFSGEKCIKCSKYRLVL